MSLDVLDESGKTKHSRRNFGLELCFAGKDDCRLNDVGRHEVEQVLHRSNMPLVLEDGISKLELSLEVDLSPNCVFRIPKDPACVVLGFDDEDAKPRNKNVINLGCDVAHSKGDVFIRW